MTVRNESLVVHYNEDGSIGSAQVTRVTRVDGVDYPAATLTISQADLSQYTVPIDAAVLAERDALAAQVQSLTNQLSQAQSSIASMVTDRDDYAIQAARVPALVADNAALTGHVEQLQSANASLAARVDELLTELDALLNPPGPDLTTLPGAKQYISQVRYAREIAGISIEGQTISTERDEIGHWFPRFYDAVQWLNNDPTARAINPGLYPYKPKNGEPVILTAAQVVRAYQCLAWYINACFATERGLYTIAEAPDAVLPDVVEMADTAATWPQQQFTWEPPQ